jgi:uncharacterized membrane protein
LKQFSAIFSTILLLAIWIGTATEYHALPQKIPMHFGFDGSADRYDDKSGIWFIVVLATAIYLLFTILYRFAYKLPAKKFGKPINQQERGILKNLFLQLRLSVLLLFAIDLFFTIHNAHSNPAKLPVWLLPVNLALIILPTIIFLVAIFRNRQSV